MRAKGMERGRAGVATGEAGMGRCGEERCKGGMRRREAGKGGKRGGGAVEGRCEEGTERGGERCKEPGGEVRARVRTRD